MGHPHFSGPYNSKTVKDTQNLRPRYRKALNEGNSNHILNIQFERETSVSQLKLLYLLYGEYVFDYPTQQKMPKRVKMFISKWHRKQRHLLIHRFRSPQCLGFVGRICLSRTSLQQPILSEEGAEFSALSLLGPLAFWLHAWTKLALAQLGYGAYNIRP